MNLIRHTGDFNVVNNFFSCEVMKLFKLPSIKKLKKICFYFNVY